MAARSRPKQRDSRTAIHAPTARSLGKPTSASVILINAFTPPPHARLCLVDGGSEDRTMRAWVRPSSSESSRPATLGRRMTAVIALNAQLLYNGRRTMVCGHRQLRKAPHACCPQSHLLWRCTKNRPLSSASSSPMVGSRQRGRTGISTAIASQMLAPFSALGPVQDRQTPKLE